MDEVDTDVSLQKVRKQATKLLQMNRNMRAIEEEAEVEKIKNQEIE